MKPLCLSDNVFHNVEFPWALQMRTLVTGGAGYIGSHTLIELLARDHDLFVIEYFANSSPEILGAVQKITGKSFRRDHIDSPNEPPADPETMVNTVELNAEEAAKVVLTFLTSWQTA